MDAGCSTARHTTVPSNEQFLSCDCDDIPTAKALPLSDKPLIDIDQQGQGYVSDYDDSSHNCKEALKI